VGVNVGDPVAIGLVPSLAHPGGNLTVVTGSGPHLDGKRLQLLNELMHPSLVGVIWILPGTFGSPASPRAAEEIQAAANILGIPTLSLPISELGEFDNAVAAAGAAGAQALMVIGTLLWMHRRHVVDVLRAAGLPTMYQSREPVMVV
jgi:putative ABC transport system substrate-binding protein